jgi:DNA replication protein DnaC
VYGPPGSGKTFLCTAMIRTMWDKGGTCRFLTAQHAANRILYNEHGRPRNGFDQEEAIKQLSMIDALFIDELNELDMKDKYINALKQLVDARARRRKRGLLIAANVDLKTVATLMGLPLADRLRDQTFDVFRIPEETPSARNILKQQMRAQKQEA